MCIRVFERLEHRVAGLLSSLRIEDGHEVTVSCAEGDEGVVYTGLLDFEQTLIELDSLPDIPVKIMMNVGNPDRAFDFANIPNHGVGLARLEFIINRMIGVHPKALLEYDQLDDDTREAVHEQENRQSVSHCVCQSNGVVGILAMNKDIRQVAEGRHCAADWRSTELLQRPNVRGVAQPGSAPGLGACREEAKLADPESLRAILCRGCEVQTRISHLFCI